MKLQQAADRLIRCITDSLITEATLVLLQEV